jgi:hypothetical protein
LNSIHFLLLWVCILHNSSISTVHLSGDPLL